MTHNSLIEIVESLLRKNKIAFDKKEFSFQIQSHPSYPSLHSITGVLDHFNIDNIAASVEVNQETLEQLPATFIAQIQMEGSDELATIVKQKSNYKAIISEKKSITLGVSEFLEKFTGIVLAVEQPEVTSKVNNKSWLSTSLWFVTAALATALYALVGPSIGAIAFLLLSVIGIMLSVAIVEQEFGLVNSIGDAFCSTISEKKDCDAVLTSECEKLPFGLKISDLSLVYFISLTLMSLIFSIQNTETNITPYLSFLALPITLYSIFYQWRVVKKWCLMCLSIVGLLWFQATLAYFTVSSPLFITPSIILTSLIIIMAVFASWFYLRTQLALRLEDEKTKIDFYRFKRNFKLFSTLLGQSELIDTAIPSEHEIVFGNAASNTEILIVTSPFCGHCKPVHSLVENMLNQYQNEVKIIIRFNVNHTNADSELVKITTRLTEINHKGGKDTCMEAMTDIYRDMKPSDWLVKWSEANDKQAYQKILEAQRNWCTVNQINFTPHIHINGRAFPEEYKKEDLVFFIEDLNESEILV